MPSPVVLESESGGLFLMARVLGVEPPFQGSGFLGVLVPGRCPGLRWVRPLASRLAFGGPIRRVMRWATMGVVFGGHVPRSLPWATMGQAFGLWVSCSQGDALGYDGSGLWPLGVMFPGRCPGLRWVRPLAFGGPIRRAMPWVAMGDAFELLRCFSSRGAGFEPGFFFGCAAFEVFGVFGEGLEHIADDLVGQLAEFFEDQALCLRL